MASYFKRNCRELTGWNRGKGIYWGGDRGSVPTDMTEMPKTRMDRALEDAQSVPNAWGSLRPSGRTGKGASEVTSG